MVAKAARTAEPEKREENLLSGVLAWSCSKAPQLLNDILTHSRRADHDSWSEVMGPFIQSPLETQTEEQVVLAGGTRRRIDVTFRFPGLLVAVENKVVPAGISVEQIEDYHHALGGETESDVDFAVVVVSPDSPEQAADTLRHLATGVDRTFHISWREIWRLAHEISGSSDPVESLSGQELKEAIELVPNLKPFSGFPAETIEVMKKVPQVKGIGEFSRALQALLESTSPGYVFRRRSTARRSYDLIVQLWDEYFDPELAVPEGVETEDIYFGPWFQLVEGNFALDVEALRSGIPVLTRALQAVQINEEAVRKRFQATFPDFALQIDPGRPRMIASIPLDSPHLSVPADGGDSELPRLAYDILRFLLNELSAGLRSI